AAQPAAAAPQEEEDELLGSEGTGAGGASRPQDAPPRHANVLVLPSRLVETSALEPFASLEDVHFSLARTLRQIAVAEAVQTVAIGLLFGLIAYAFYADQFVGTPKELIIIFFWAFSLDLTVARLIEVAKTVK